MVRTAVTNGVGAKTRRKSYARTSDLIELPRLIDIQLQSFEWFHTKGLKELFEEISPIVSFNKHLELHFGDFRFDEAKHTEEACRERDITYSAPLWVQVKLVNKDTGEISEQEVFMGDFPQMTDSGTFIVNGSERVVVSQLIRSPGVYFTIEEDRSTGRDLTGTKLIPSRGAWLEFETSKRDIISVKVDRKRKLPVTILLRAIGYGTDEEIRTLFADVDDDEDHPFIEATLERDPTANPTEDQQKGIDDARLEFYKKLRPGDPPTLDNARNFLQNLLFSSRRYDLGRVGRYKLNRKLKLELPLTTRILTNDDIVSVIRRIVDINNGREIADDIDHLGNRRIKTVGELIQYQLRIGLLRMERVVRERMSIREPEQVTPLSLINIRPVVAATREFFGSSQLSQFMDQTNPLAELTHKRRLSALGPGGLRRERAGFDVRDVHYSHYGRICPIETPEGPNIGLIGYLASYGRINDFGFIETPYRRVINTVRNLVKEVTRRILAQDIVDPYSGDILNKSGDEMKPESAQMLAALYPRLVEEVKERLLSGLEQEEQSRIAEFVERIGLFSSEARSQAEQLKDSIQSNLGETAKEDQRLEWLDDIILIGDVVEAHHVLIVDFYEQGRLDALKSVLDALKQEEQSQIEALSERIDRSSSEAHSHSQRTKKWIQRNFGETAKKDQHLDWLDDVILVDDVVEARHDRMVDFCVQGRLDALKSVLGALKQEEQSQIEALSERINRSSSEAHSRSQRMKKWIQSNLGETVKKDQHLDWLDDVILVDDVVEAKHDRMVDFCVQGRLDALQSVSDKATSDIREPIHAKRAQLHQELDVLEQEEESQIAELTARIDIDRSSSEAHSQARRLKKWIQSNLGETAKEDQHLNWVDDAIISGDEIVEEKYQQIVNDYVQERLNTLQSTFDEERANIREPIQAKRAQLHQELDVLEQEEESQIAKLAARIDRSSSEARSQAQQLKKWIQSNLGERAKEVQRLDWVDAIISGDEAVETKHDRMVDYCVEARLAALKSVSDKEEADIRAQIAALAERIDIKRSSSEARSQAKRLKKWIESNLGKEAKEVQRLDWVDAIISGDEAVETKHDRMVDYCVEARLAALKSVSDKEEADIQAQIAALAERIDTKRSSSEARSQAKRLKKWIESNLGKEAKEVQRLDWVDAIISGDEAVETKHDRMVDYCVQGRLDALQFVSEKVTSYFREWIRAKRTRLEDSGEEEQSQIDEFAARINRSSSEARSQAEQLQEWIQNNLGKKTKEDQYLAWEKAAIIVNDEVVKAEHEQNVNDYLQTRLTTLQSESDEEEAYIRVAGQAKRIDDLTGEKKDGEVLPKLDEQIFAQKDLIDAMRELKEFRVRPFVSEEVIYLNADSEERSSIAQASTPLDKAGHFLNRRPSVRQAEEFRFEDPERIQYMDVSPKQVVGVSAALIPFLEHDDTNRALMGSNMQRQAVPLVQPEAPIVGTGMERQAAVDSGQVVVAGKAGEAVRVVNTEVVIQEDDGALRTYPLRKYNRSNQSTCIDQRPTVQKGDRVEAGTVLADSSSTQNGELALGQNVLVAYMSWEGGNYEDAILVSERLVENDKYTSVHIEKHEIEARETKLGPEEITRDIPNVGEDALRHLDEDGIIRIGAEVVAGDILVGKITPKGETELTPEEKLLRAIFGEKAREVKDSSLRLPHGERGKVVDIKVFTRDDHQDMPAGVEMMVRVSIAQRRRLTEGDKMAGRHGNKGVISRVVPVEDMPFLEDGTPIDIILNPLGVPGRMNIGQVLETHLGWAADRLGFMVETPVFDGAKEDEIESELARAWLIDRAWEDVTQKAWASVREQEIDSESLTDDNDARRIYLLDWLEPRGYDPEQFFFDDIYARNAALSEWLQDKGYEAERVIPETRSDASDAYARHVALREWMSYHGGELDGLDGAALAEAARQHSIQVGWPLPTTGKQKLFDGKTGEPYDANVTVGIAQMLKLHHLVEDKVHARSTGPYSLVTQQPLGGKAQFGGQRFGEMEVWALEAYGAAHTLQEMLTIKSDDTTGRVKTYEAIVKGDEIQSPGVPESFRVLVKELQSLALSIEVINDKNEVIQLGKDETEERLPQLGFSLNVPSPMSRSSE